jgi:hypothetical protein
LDPGSDTIGARALVRHELVARWDWSAEAVVGHEHGTDASPFEQPFHPKQLGCKAKRRKLYAVVEPIPFGENVFGERIEKIETLVGIPRDRGHVSYGEPNVVRPEFSGEARSVPDEPGALIDPVDGDLRIHTARYDAELPGATTNVEDAPRAVVAEARCYPNGNRYRRPVLP